MVSLINILSGGWRNGVGRVADSVARVVDSRQVARALEFGSGTDELELGAQRLEWSIRCMEIGRVLIRLLRGNSKLT